MSATAAKNTKDEKNENEKGEKSKKPGAGIHEEAAAALKRLEAKDPGLKQFLKKAYGYVVFPSIGKAALVVGGGYGKGLVFERGKPVGYATIGKVTLGVDLGGQTFSEVIAFESREVFERFKKGRFAFSADASAVIVKAGASGTADYEKGAVAFAYSRGGLLLELSLGGQKFKFKPMSQQQGKGEAQQGEDWEGEEGGEEGDARAESSEEGEEGEEGEGEDEDQQDRAEAEAGNEGEGDEGEGDEGEGEGDEQGGAGLLSRAAGLLRDASGGTATKLRNAAGNVAGRLRGAASGAAKVIGRHPAAAAAVGGGLAAGAIFLAARAMGASAAGDDAAESVGGEEDEDRAEGRDDTGSDEEGKEGEAEDNWGDEAQDDEGEAGEREEVEEVGGRFASRGRSRH